MKISIIFSFTFRAVATAFKIFSLTATSFAPSATTITPVIFGATVGLEADRLIKRYSRLDTARAVMLQAIGAERIEALCDAFCADIEENVAERGLFTRPRFSPGYGDLPLEIQRDFVRVLDCRRKIGVTLNESLLMSPSKSVTAIIGLSDKPCGVTSGDCGYCGKRDCAYRKEEK